MKDDVLFDSDKCIWKRDFGYDSMSLKEFDEYANIAATFAGHFVGNYEHLSIEMNRLEKRFVLSSTEIIQERTNMDGRSRCMEGIIKVAT